MHKLCFQKWVFAGILFLLFSFTSFTHAQTGTITGTLKDTITGEPVVGAIFACVEDPNIGAQTDLDGYFEITGIKPGTYTFAVSYIGYKTQTISNVVVTAGGTIELKEIYLQEDNEIGTIEIIGQVQTNTEEAVVQEIRESDNVVSGISQEQIQKGQDKDASQVVQRIPGVTVVDNRFILIRGLNDRYNSVWLNNATAPSSETDRKAFSFDMVPSGLIDRILVFKTPSPDLPGDFAGGFVKIYTVTPKTKVFNVNLGLSYRNGTTGRSFYNDRSSTDWLGFDNGQRALPSNLPVYTSVNGLSNSTVDSYSKSFNNNWGTRTYNAAPDVRFNVNYMNSFAMRRASKFGVLASLNYSNLNTTYNIKRTDTDGSGTKTQLRDDFQYTNEVRVAGMLNFSYIIDTSNKIEFRNFINQNGRTQITNRNLYDAGNNLSRQQYALAYRSRTIYTSQLAGEHTLKNNKTKVDWTLGYGYSLRNEPDLRRATYYPDPSNSAGSLVTPANNANDITNGGRLYQKLNENSILLSANLTQQIHKKWGFLELAEIDAGTYNEIKTRSFHARAFANTLQGSSKGGTFWNDTLQYLPLDQVYDQSNMQNGNGWTILEEDNPTYKYDASNRMIAAYVSGKFNIGSRTKLVMGVRNENNDQRLTSSIVKGHTIHTDLATNFLLPSVNLSYNFTDKQLVRVAYGRTVNRPEFREFAPFYFYDFDFNAINYGSLYFGQPLKVCTIDNVDLRYEYYPSPNEMISVALFYKNFKNPIEQIAIATSGGAGAALAYSYTNALGAYNTGIEIDIRKNLGFVSAKLEKFTFVFNTALIKSQVSIPTDKSDYWNAKRNLQGQSPYMINGGLYYQNDDNGWSASVLYNIFGPRIVIVGNSNYPDVVETQRSSIDLSVTKNITKKLAINIGAPDILNQKVIWVQDFNRDGKYKRDGSDNQLLSYRKGNYVTATLRYTF